MSTILEAALRTLFGHPFVSGDRTFNIGRRLTEFRKKYLDDEWTAACKSALGARSRLRHRNAHPDWLSSADGSESPARYTQALDDIIFLCHFYGYMVLAVAGIQVKPRFPISHTEWPPLYDVHTHP